MSSKKVACNAWNQVKKKIFPDGMSSPVAAEATTTAEAPSTPAKVCRKRKNTPPADKQTAAANSVCAEAGTDAAGETDATTDDCAPATPTKASSDTVDTFVVKTGLDGKASGEAGDDVNTATPTKRRRGAGAAAGSAKAPRTPRTPKSPKAPKTPRPKTGKTGRAAATKAGKKNQTAAYDGDSDGADMGGDNASTVLVKIAQLASAVPMDQANDARDAKDADAGMVDKAAEVAAEA